MGTTKKSKADPELLKLINASTESPDSIQAIFSLDLPTLTVDPVATERTTYTVLRDVVEQVGYKPDAVSIFRDLGAFAVYADAPFIQKIIEHPDITSAIGDADPVGTSDG